MFNTWQQYRRGFPFFFQVVFPSLAWFFLVPPLPIMNHTFCWFAARPSCWGNFFFPPWRMRITTNCNQNVQLTMESENNTRTEINLSLATKQFQIILFHPQCRFQTSCFAFNFWVWSFTASCVFFQSFIGPNSLSTLSYHLCFDLLS